jgi:hypothetical protein
MAKSSSRATAEKTKTAVVLSTLAIQRLGAACVAESMTQSELVEWMIHDRLKGYAISKPSLGERVGKRKSSASVMTDESADLGDHVNSHVQVSRSL